MIDIKEYLVCGKPDITKAEEEAVLEVLRSGWLGYGKVAQELEEEFKKFFWVDHAVAVNSASIGLLISLRSCHVGFGDEVITTPLTFCATVNSILQLGAKPVFVDVKENGCIDEKLIRDKVTHRTKAVLPVHLWGVPCDMETILKISRDYARLKVIADCAHVFEGTYQNVYKTGVMGDVNVFSFYPTKNIASCDGGMIMTNDSQIAERARIFSNQGLSDGAWKRHSNESIKEYQVIFDGYKGQMNDVSAAIALAQFKRRVELKEKRNKVFRIYEEHFGKKDTGHSQHIYEIRVKNGHRNFYRKKLHEMGIGTGVHYSPLHLENAYKFLGYEKGSFTMAERIGLETLTLPLSSSMDEIDAMRVVEAVKEVNGELSGN